MMDFFSDPASKKALHNTDLRSIALNFQSSDPKLGRIRDESYPHVRNQAFGPYASLKAAVKPPMGLYMQAQRFFHAKFLGDYNIFEKENKEESKKKFFKFLQTAEALDSEMSQRKQKPEAVSDVKFDEIEVSFDFKPKRDAQE